MDCPIAIDNCKSYCHRLDFCKDNARYWLKPRLRVSLRTLRYEDGKARTATAVVAGNFRGSRRVARSKMLKMCIFANDGDVNNLNFT